VQKSRDFFAVADNLVAMNSDLDDLVSTDQQRSPGVQMKDTVRWPADFDA
jgi:hypothetical protein